eukprot:Skav235109  [mRNA]  locus=scaffold711:286088:290602:+ [translate_table: standard]
MSFAELQQHVLRLATAVGRNRCVAICCHRNLGLVVSILAVLWRKSTFVPLDPRYPASRLRFMLEDSEAAMLVTQQDILEAVPELGQVLVKLLIDSTGELVHSSDALNQMGDAIVGPSVPPSAAYVIYTSGSTGVPKGVMVSRRNLANVLISFKELLQGRLSAQRRGRLIRWMAHTTISFDIALLELLLPLIGDFGDLVLEILDQSTTQIGEHFKNHLESPEAQSITVLQATPSTFTVLRSAGWTPSENSLLLCGGEIFPVWLTANPCSAEIYNVYGPTETTIWSLVHRLEPGEKTSRLGVPIGQAIRGTTVQLDTETVEKSDETSASGELGELVIGGEGVSLGYWKRPELTSSRFFEADGVRYFRTGDLIQQIKDGPTGTTKLFCLGRLDEQVKLNGFRIELGEIEMLLNSMDEIQQSAVEVRCNSLNVKVLVAYVVWKTETEQVTRNHDTVMFLRKHLPDHMLPQHFVSLKSLPTTLNGKVDRKQLPDPWLETAQSQSNEEQRMLLRQIVLQVIQDVIAGRTSSTPSVPMNHLVEGEHWRHLGLNSTMATYFSAGLQDKLKKCLGKDVPKIPPSIMFQYATVSELVSFLSKSQIDPKDAVQSPATRTEALRSDDANTLRAMEHWGLRRWPSPFDWIFSAPEMVKHCLAETAEGGSFATFLDQTKYVAKPCNKAATATEDATWHEIYSEMLQHEVIFNHHNPMLAKDYAFFKSTVTSLQALMVGDHSPSLMEESLQSNSMVLFLLFNLERRFQLKDVAIQELFQELNSQCCWVFQLLVVKVHTKAVETPQHRLLLEDRCFSTKLNTKQFNQLLVYELLCQGTHDGWRFSDEKDMQSLGEIVLTGRDFRLLSAPAEKFRKCGTFSCPFSSTWLSTHCCHSCAKTSGARHGDKCDRLLQGLQGTWNDEGKDAAGYLGGPSSAGIVTLQPGQPVSGRPGTVSRASRFQESLSKARRMQRTKAGSLQLQSSAIRKLQRSLLSKQAAAPDSWQMGGITEEWQFLGFPIYEDGCRIWCPDPSDLLAAFQTLMDPWR